jgi:glycosyltransferase involved in cell wall biosynthesis
LSPLSTVNKTLSIVIPVYNEASGIARLHERLGAVLKSLPYDNELLFVDDGSVDATAQILADLARVDANIRVICFSRNFGKEAATTAGLREARGDAIIMIDADLQHPPELIPALVAAWEEQNEVVIGVRNPRPGESWLRRLGSRVFARTMNVISDVEAPLGATDYRLIDRKVADAFASLTEHGRLTRALIDWVGFRRIYIYFNAAEREGGENKYSYIKLASTAVGAIVTHSRVPLIVAGALGLFITCIAFLLGAVVLIEQIWLGDPWGLKVTGTAMLAIMILFLNGIVLIFVGLLSLYVSMVQREAAGRPLYVIRSDSKA